MFLGFIFLPASAFGLLLGSFLMSGLKLRHKKALQTCFIVSIMGLLAQLIITLSCEDVAFAGITVPYAGQRWAIQYKNKWKYEVLLFKPLGVQKWMKASLLWNYCIISEKELLPLCAGLNYAIRRVHFNHLVAERLMRVPRVWEA